MHLLDVGGNWPVRLYMEWHFWQLCGHYPKLTPRQQQEIIHLVDTGQKTAADAARLFNVHPSAVARLMARSHSAEGTSA